jgi:DNA polymerase V
MFTYTLFMKGAHVGFAAPAEEELADTITIGEYLIHHKESTYLLEVEGDALAEDGIHAGDRVLFERRSDALPGEIVVVLTEDGYTLRRFKKQTSMQVVGIVTASFRTYA